MALFGFFKKVAIANQLAPFVNNAYANIDSADGSLFWILLVIQPLYLYFDFSGYTDIALGLAKTFGIELAPNFSRPFLSENMTNFWKRFHISFIVVQ
jgi:D-alanyl-lipoteichoic acid acyltransferase DltB (MBOAT superfamily)